MPILSNLNEIGIDSEIRSKKIIASLTTFPKRINKVHKTIQTILTQTLKPDKVILYLTSKEFPNKEEDLPENLLKLKEFGLEIEWCEYMRSYQKIVPAMMKYPDDIIITFDDDFYYPNNLIYDLYTAYLKEPKCIHANRTWRGYFNKDKFEMYSTNKMFTTKFEDKSYFNLLMGYGVVLYPPHSLNEQFNDSDKFMNLIPTHDDVWLWAMSVLNRTKTIQEKGFNFSILPVEDTQEVALHKVNHKGSTTGMDTKEAYRKILMIFPEIINILKEESND